MLTPEFTISDEDALRALFPPTHEVAVKKCIDHLDAHARAFIARSPFLCIGTNAADSTADVSPRGDPNGFVNVLDDKTLLIPDRPGNNRLDTLSNIVANPHVGILFMVPGYDETVRVNGTAQVTCDPDLLGLCKMHGRAPRVAIVVSVHEVFMHCAKAFRRAKLWDPSTHQDRSEMPSLLKVVRDQIGEPALQQAEQAQVDADLEASYKSTMY